MSAIKVLHLSNIIGEKKGGGIHEVVANFYKYQKQLQHEPSIWYPGDEADADKIRIDGNIRALTAFGSGQLGVLKGLVDSVPSAVHRFDIIHQHGIWTPLSLYAQKIRRASKLKMVIQPHGFLEPYRLNISKYRKKLAFHLFEKSNLLNASALVACSEDEAVKLKGMFPQNDVAVVFNGVDPHFYRAQSQRSIGVKEKRRMLFLSQIIPVKGLERLFHVIAEIGTELFSDWEFLIAGYGDDVYLESLRSLAIQLNLGSLINFVGPKIGSEKIRIYDNSDVFILPTFSENYGIVVAEALARGIPVVTTKGTPWVELSELSCGLWVENSHEGIKDGILKVLNLSSAELMNMGQKGRALIKEKYLWDKTTERTIILYRWLLHGGRKPDFVL
ncbi:glycosyltransferase [Gammaproteobacteria bacterium]|nr:glycosyltransferase [Gammaproteobacteria bacterium]